MIRFFEFAFISCLMLSIVGCRKKDFDIKNLNGNKIEVIGHGGMGHKLSVPMNSLKSFEKAIEAGVNGIEMDIQMTKDKKLVVFHDKYLGEESTGEGIVYQTNWLAIDALYYKNVSFSKQEILSLSQLLSCLDYSSDLQFVLDIKTYDPNNSEEHIESYATAIIEVIEEFDIENQVIVEFNRLELAKSLHEKKPSVLVFFYTGFEYAFDKAIELGLTGITSDYSSITQDQIDQAHEHNLQIALFGTDSKSKNIEAIEMNPDFIQTDEVKHLVKVLN